MRALLFICFTLILTIVQAQPRVVTFGEEGTEPTNPAPKNLIKLNPFEFVAGDFSIYYERILTEKLTAEVGIGMTNADLYGLVNYIDLYSPFNNFVTPKMGFSFTAAIRFYPIEALEGIYVAPEFKYRKYNWERITYDDLYFFDEPYDNEQMVEEDRTYTIPRITFGWMILYDNNLSLDWSIGLGMNTAKENIYNEETMMMEVRKRGTNPRLNLGLKIAYAF
ncbi:DUF3575 domain-containing protein [Brumimicrobium oceani]|uniref:DUF3575 domain-containing protein n=1 Tax=Brumimicrobium oceani TaxID=2100725 RepID=A0A2U2X0S0_9FLAO|nr:DUF3575 domain-containing protein [Brumimicrobium oceani]PWH81385.1 hypothetical protein DIT68_15265 [Brumimicrobium oceani]